MSPKQRFTTIIPPICPEETPLTVSNTINPPSIVPKNSPRPGIHAKAFLYRHTIPLR